MRDFVTAKTSLNELAGASGDAPRRLPGMRLARAALFFAGLASFAAAQPLTLAQALREALQNNPGYLASRAERGYADNALSSQGLAGYLPSVYARGTYNWSELDTRQERFVSGATTTESVSGAQLVSRTAGLNAEWTLFEGFAAPLERKRLRYRRDQARAAEGLTREDLIRRAALAFADLARQARLRDVRDTLLDLS